MSKTALVLACLAAALGLCPPAAAGERVPEWAAEAVDYLAEQGYLDRAEFRGDETMPRAAWGELLVAAFGGAYERTRGHVKAREVDALLVRRLGYGDVAKRLDAMASPSGWAPAHDRWLGTEIVARELGLRHNRPTTEDAYEASANEALSQADIAWAVWRAKTGPSHYGAEALRDFSLPEYDAMQRDLVEFAFAQVGQPYVWAGEWVDSTAGSDYPFGDQAHGGFDCSGFAWYILREASEEWEPRGRPYAGWSFDERSSRDMAAAAEPRLRFEDLTAGDVVFFSNDGRDAKPSSIFHAGIYLGNGWMIHSSGSRAGVSLTNIDEETWWAERLAWGRRIISQSGE